MTSRARWIILILALAGLAVATASAWVHFRLLTDPSYSSVCDINATFNCSQVYLSQYGSIRGVPVALGGIIWFALVALVAGLAPTIEQGDDHPAGAYIFALSIVGLATILYFGYISFFVLRTGCVLCMSTYVAVIGIFITSGASRRMSLGSLPPRLGPDLSALFSQSGALAAALLYLGGAVALVAFFPREGITPTATPAAPGASVEKAFADAWFQQPRLNLGIPTDGALVVVVKFNDYQCPGCKQTHDWYAPILARYAEERPGAVKMVVKDWPWNMKCNFNISITLHPGACEAAAAVRMAADRGKADEMEAWLYGNQLTLTADTVKEAAGRLLGVTDFDREYALKLPDIQRDIADGGALSVTSTPTLFINGVRVPGNGLMPPEYFDLAIKLELERAEKTDKQ
jgi:uncharacterized membrane protein/protein-disulfide isomerase